MSAPAKALSQISYSDLYRRWEVGNWRSTEIDFSADKEQWRERFSETQRRAAIWNYAMFLHGEGEVADTLAPFITAAPRPEHRYMFTTQQVDEARHAVFFGRFMNEVAALGDTFDSSLATTEPQLTWGFRHTFAALDRVSDRLRRKATLPNLAAAITLYHIVIEGALAQPGQHFIERYLSEMDVLPGFHEGLKKIMRDEQRHIAFGTKLLSELVAQSEECKAAAIKVLRDVNQYVLAVFVPPNWDRSYTECFNFTLEEIYAEGNRALEQKTKMIGLPVEELHGALPLETELEPKLRAEHVLTLLNSNIIGEKQGPPGRDPHTVKLLFDLVEHSVDTRAAPDHGHTTKIQWEFSDTAPWYLEVQDGTAETQSGYTNNPDLTLRCDFETWVDIVARRQNPGLAMLTGKLRPKGNPRMLLQLGKMFRGAS